MMMINQSRFHTNFTKMIPIKPSLVDEKNQTNTTKQSNKETVETEHFPITVEAHEYDLAHDQGILLIFYFTLIFLLFCF